MKQEKRIAGLYFRLSQEDKMGLSGFCYTQLTDVQQEVNGLLREDRTSKVPLEEIRKRNHR